MHDFESLQVKIPSNHEIYTKASQKGSDTKLKSESSLSVLPSSNNTKYRKGSLKFSAAEPSGDDINATQSMNSQIDEPKDSLMSVNEVFKSIRLEKAIEGNQLSIDKVIFLQPLK